MPKRLSALVVVALLLGGCGSTHSDPKTGAITALSDSMLVDVSAFPAMDKAKFDRLPDVPAARTKVRDQLKPPQCVDIVYGPDGTDQRNFHEEARGHVFAVAVTAFKGDFDVRNLVKQCPTAQYRNNTPYTFTVQPLPGLPDWATAVRETQGTNGWMLVIAGSHRGLVVTVAVAQDTGDTNLRTGPSGYGFDEPNARDLAAVSKLFNDQVAKIDTLK